MLSMKVTATSKMVSIIAATIVVGLASAIATVSAGATAHGRFVQKPPLFKTLPASIRQSGVIRLATSADFPPDNYLATDNKTLTGYSADLINAIARRLGVKVAVVKTPFVQVITGLAAKRYDIGISFLDTKEREQQVDILNVWQSSVSFTSTKASGPVTRIPCGKSVGVGIGSAEAVQIGEISKTQCEAKGQPAIDVHTYPNSPDAYTAMSSGRLDVVFASTPSAAWTVKQSNGALVIGMAVSQGALGGIASRKDLRPLTLAMEKAVVQMMKSGQYQKILARWNVSGIGIKLPRLNGAKS
jgi:polar amino acid transport system substrate-binding protein